MSSFSLLLFLGEFLEYGLLVRMRIDVDVLLIFELLDTLLILMVYIRYIFFVDITIEISANILLIIQWYILNIDFTDRNMLIYITALLLFQE
jgi:hypothetical protein